MKRYEIKQLLMERAEDARKTVGDDAAFEMVVEFALQIMDQVLIPAALSDKTNKYAPLEPRAYDGRRPSPGRSWSTPREIIMSVYGWDFDRMYRSVCGDGAEGESESGFCIDYSDDDA